MKFFRILFFLFVLTLPASAQNNLILKTDSKNFSIPVYERQGTLYFSVKHFAEALAINYFYSPETEKIELKFSDYNLKITAKNPFLIQTPKSGGESVVYQIPTSSYLINGNIFIPLVYSLDILKSSSGINLNYEAPRTLSASGSSPDSKNIDEQPPVTPSAFNLTGIAIDERANGTLIRLKSNKKIKTYNSNFKDGVLTITLRDALADPDKLNKTGRKGLVKEIKAINKGKDSQIQFTVGKEFTTSEVIDAAGSNDILITIHNKIFARNESLDKYREKWNFDVVVIDAGHGGKDVGAVGVNGVREKDVNLAVALKLGKLIKENLKDVKVVYTRDDDTFVELYKRGKIANESGGKLFISIHCNSTPKKPTDANGFEVYLLRPGRTKEAIAIAERENSVIQYEENPERYEQLTDENFILVSMAHSSYMKYSEKFAELLNRQFSNDLSLSSRGVKQAGFFVLVGASMPSVLIETGFLSNKSDAAYLKTSKGQQKYAESIFQSVKKFKEYYDSFILND